MENEQVSMGEISAEAGSKAVEMWRPLEFNTQLGYDYLQTGFWKTFFHYLALYPALGILRILDTLVFGLHIHGMKRYRALKHTGVVGVCNHVHYMDCTMIALALWRKRMYFMTLEENFRIPVVKQIIRVLGAVPQSNHPHRTKELFSQLETALKNGAAVQIYPERVLRPYYNLGTRKMQRGAFKMAVEANVPMLPMVVTYREPKGLYRLFKKKPCMDLTILDPIHPPKADTPQESARLLQNQVEEAMNREMQKHPYSFGNSKKESARKMILARRQKNFTFFPSSLCVGEGFSAFSGEIGKRICPERSSVL